MLCSITTSRGDVILPWGLHVPKHTAQSQFHWSTFNVQRSRPNKPNKNNTPQQAGRPAVEGEDDAPHLRSMCNFHIVIVAW